VRFPPEYPAVLRHAGKDNMTTDPKDSGSQENCFRCVHYFVTHDPARPYGCRTLGFKSSQIPAVVVFADSGMPCHLYTVKKAGKRYR
jgi:hypothetical protein